MDAAIFSLHTDIQAGTRYRATVVVDVAAPSEDMPPALIAFTFRGANGDVLEEPLDGFAQSTLYGPFLYAGKPRMTGPLYLEVDFWAPEGAATAELQLHRWRAGYVGLIEALELAKIDTEVEDEVSEEGPSERIKSDTVITSLHTDIQAGTRYRATVVVDVAAPSEDMSPALIAFTFRGANGDVLKEPLDGFAQSTLYGTFLYAGKPRMTGPLYLEVDFWAPEGAATAELQLHRWRAGYVGLIEALELAKIDTEVNTKGNKDSDDFLALIETPVNPGAVYDLEAVFSGADGLAKRFALVTFAFQDATGTDIPPTADTPISEAVGCYRYFELVEDAVTGPNSERLARVIFCAPERAVKMELRIIRWNADENLVLRKSEIKCLSDPERISGSGEAKLSLGTWFALKGKVRARGVVDEKVALIDFVFLDQAGQPINKTAEGLYRSPGFVNYTYGFYPEDGSLPEGEMELHVVFRPPAGSKVVRWRAQPWEGCSELFLEHCSIRNLPLTPQSQILALPDVARNQADLYPEQVGALRDLLPTGELWRDVAFGKLKLLAESMASVEASTWTMVSGRLDVAKQVAQKLRLAICPVYFDALGGCLSPKSLLGCVPSDRIGLYRHVALKPASEGYVSFDEPFCVPDAAAFAAFYLLDLSGGYDIITVEISSRPVSSDKLFTELDSTVMNKSMLKCAAEIADTVWDLPARKEIYTALSIVEPGVRQHEVKARAHADQLLELNTSWLPPMPSTPSYKPLKKSVMHLLKVLYPDESSGGAVRSTSILEAQAAYLGLSPVACMPFLAPRVPHEFEVDGITEIVRNGVSVNYLQFPAINPRHVPISNILTFEAHMHQRVLEQHRCSLIHAASGFRGYENALKGIALAKANHLPFVYEVRSFHEHTWRSISDRRKSDLVTTLRAAQENRCMAEADAVVTISHAMAENLKARGVPEESIFVVPNSISDEFRTKSSLADVARLRYQYGFEGVKTIGYISNFSLREGHRVLLDAFTRLILGGSDLHLIMVGEGPERQEILKEVKKRGLADRVTMPGNVNHAEVKAWYRAIDLFVVPRIVDFASDYVTPLKPFEAMSQGVPVLMADRPVTREIAGEREERAVVFPAGDDEALAAHIEYALSNPTEQNSRAEAAYDWVLKERVWEKTIKHYDDIYTSARDAHARKSAWLGVK